VLTKRCGNAPRKLAILKQLQTHFKAKHEKGVGTEFPHVLAPLNPCLTPHWNKSVLQLEITNAQQHVRQTEFCAVIGDKNDSGFVLPKKLTILKTLAEP